MSSDGLAAVVLVGAPGVGKTRLAREVLSGAARRGHPTAWAQATRSARPIPFGALAHLLPPNLSGSGRNNLLRQAGEALTVSAGESALVLGVDDAHQLDDSSAALLRHLVDGRVCFVVVTIRSNELAPDAILSLCNDDDSPPPGSRSGRCPETRWTT